MPLVREVRSILYRLPVDPCFDLEQTEARYPRSYDQSLNVVLLQEIARYNGLVKEVRRQLVGLLEALAG